MHRHLLSLATAAVALGAGGCASSPPAQPISFGCNSVDNTPISDADVSVDVADLGPTTTVQLHQGETVTLGYSGPCGVAAYPSAAGTDPVLVVTSRKAGVTTYRAARPGQVTARAGANGPSPYQAQIVTVVVLPAETSAQTARRGTGTITITGASSGPNGTFPLSGVSCRRVISQRDWPIGQMTFTTGAVTYLVAFSAVDPGPPTFVDLGRPVATGMDWYIGASDPDPGTRPATLLDGGWVSGPARSLDGGRSGGTIAVRWWC